jgi:hypothetical protein
VKNTTAGGYGKLKGVDPEEDVHDVTARWVSNKNLDVDPSLVTLRLVPCAPGDDPSEEQELAATALSPRRTLRDAGIADGCSLLACSAGVPPGACGCRRARARTHV